MSKTKAFKRKISGIKAPSVFAQEGKPRLSAPRAFQDFQEQSSSESSDSPVDNAFLGYLKGKIKLTAADFRKVWIHYDTDGSGYIEAEEIDSFLTDLYAAQGTTVNKRDVAGLRRTLLECYDANGDGKIEVAEMTKILPVESNFLLNFRLQNNVMTYENFLKIWDFYDDDASGYLEKAELSNFIMDMVRTTQDIILSDIELELIVNDIFTTMDENGDGLIEFDEMRKFLKVEAKKDCLSTIDLNQTLTNKDFNKIFNYYDTDGSGYLEEDELISFVRDMMQKAGLKITSSQLHTCVQGLIKVADQDSDGQVSREELAKLFCP